MRAPGREAELALESGVRFHEPPAGADPRRLVLALQDAARGGQLERVARVARQAGADRLRLRAQHVERRVRAGIRRPAPADGTAPDGRSTKSVTAAAMARIAISATTSHGFQLGVGCGPGGADEGRLTGGVGGGAGGTGCRGGPGIGTVGAADVASTIVASTIVGAVGRDGAVGGDGGDSVGTGGAGRVGDAVTGVTVVGRTGAVGAVGCGAVRATEGVGVPAFAASGGGMTNGRGAVAPAAAIATPAAAGELDGVGVAAAGAGIGATSNSCASSPRRYSTGVTHSSVPRPKPRMPIRPLRIASSIPRP